MTASTDRWAGAARPQRVALTDASPAELLALSDAAHWNQTEEDWRAMLAISQGLAWGVRVRDAATGGTVLAASTLVLPYQPGEANQPPFAWISMVLVLPPWRGHGFAGALLRRALDELAARRLRPVLDATPAGRPVYLRQGFVDGWGFTRWRRKAVAGAVVAAPPVRGPMAGIRPRRAADWPAIEALDRPAFGANRVPLLRLMSRRLPQAAWVAEKDGALRGYLLGRDGRTALQLGPLVADDDRTALALLQAGLPAVGATAAASGRDVIVDLRDACRGIAAWLQGTGFVAERPFTRMVHGRGGPPGDAARQVLMAGPELG
ncbi:MAG: GNAT family N-acetyltransferase [Rubrivivax sp.]|nr:GNAT family N-acetyltransferase [Rubrivivax sp.]